MQRVAAIVAARTATRPAARVLEETAVYLGAGIADLVNLFNPERVVVGGWLGQLLGDRLLPRIREVAGEQALRLPFSHVAILRSRTRRRRRRARRGHPADRECAVLRGDAGPAGHQPGPAGGFLSRHPADVRLG